MNKIALSLGILAVLSQLNAMEYISKTKKIKIDLEYQQFLLKRQEELNKRLNTALISGNILALEQALQDGGDVNDQGDKDFPVLIALEKKPSQLCNDLLNTLFKYEINPNVLYSNGIILLSPILLYAFSRRDLYDEQIYDFLKNLDAKGALWNYVDSSGRNAIMSVPNADSRCKSFAYLISKTKNLNTQDYLAGHTTLMNVTMGAQLVNFKLLLLSGRVDIRCCSKNGKKAEDYVDNFSKENERKLATSLLEDFSAHKSAVEKEMQERYGISLKDLEYKE